MNTKATNYEDIKKIENYIITFTKSNGYLPTRKDIMKSIDVGKVKLNTAIKISRCLHLIKEKKTYNIRISGRVLEEIINHFKDNPQKGKYFDKFINSLEENISYERHT